MDRQWDLDDSQKDLLEFVPKLVHLRLKLDRHRRRFFTGREPGDPDDKIPRVEWMVHTGIMDMEDWSNTHAFSVMIYLNSFRYSDRLVWQPDGGQ